MWSLLGFMLLTECTESHIVHSVKSIGHTVAGSVSNVANLTTLM